MPSDIEAVFAHHLKSVRLPKPQTEYPFAKEFGLRYRFDFAWPALMLAVEIEGGLYAGGRHNRAKGYEEDLLKYNLAARLGWMVLRYSSKHVISGIAISDVEEEINSRKKTEEKA